MEVVRLPRPTLERLPLYYRAVGRCLKEDVGWISSAELGRLVGVDENQVRKDFTYLGVRGRPGLGYEVRALVEELRQLLGVKNVTEAVMVGAGRLGSAICEYANFSAYGLKVVALFDRDPENALARIDLPVLPLGKLPDLARRLGIKMGIITVPGASAQSVAELMVESGIKAIWNYAPVQLRVPEDVHVRNEDLAVGLSILSYHLKAHL